VGKRIAAALGAVLATAAYVGEETGPGFTDSAWYTTLTGVVLILGA
jgi:hypothetical protein